MSTAENRMKIHLPTLIAISIIAWALVDILHEIVGHAGVAIVVEYLSKPCQLLQPTFLLTGNSLLKNTG